MGELLPLGQTGVLIRDPGSSCRVCICHQASEGTNYENAARFSRPQLSLDWDLKGRNLHELYEHTNKTGGGTE
jgi:hypothetical protein